MKPPAFVSVHNTYMPPLGEQTGLYAWRWDPRELTGIDADGNVWGLYRDMSVPDQKVLRWIKFEVEAATP